MRINLGIREFFLIGGGFVHYQSRSLGHRGPLKKIAEDILHNGIDDGLGKLVAFDLDTRTLLSGTNIEIQTCGQVNSGSADRENNSCYNLRVLNVGVYDRHGTKRE